MTYEPVSAEEPPQQPRAIVEPAAGAAPTASRWEDYVDVFFSPAELFARRAADRVAPPLITLLAMALLFYFVLLPANLMVMRASVADNPQAMQALDQFGTLMQVIGSVAVPVTYVVVLAVAAALLWLVGRFADIRIDYSRAMLIATYAGFVYLLAQVAGGVAVLLHGEAGLDMVRHVSFGPLRFVGDRDMDPALMAVLRRLDLFTLWQAVLWGIGIGVVYRVSRSRAFTVAAVTWLLLAIPAVLMAVLGIGQGPRGG
jgi:hypothetical protein